MSTYVTATLRRLIASRANVICEYCLIHEEDTFLGCQVEHIISKKHGGETAEFNLAFACAFCNRFKGTDIAGVSQRTGALCRLFNPRTDQWSEHFRLAGSEIFGVTDIGECTARLLGFNKADRLLERETLMELGRYPCAAARQMIELAGD